MYVPSTTVQNNFGKYLKLCEIENVVITKNGKKRALLLHYPRDAEGYETGEPLLAYTPGEIGDPSYGTSPKKEAYVTYREFLEMTENSDRRYELIDGVVYLLASPGFSHQTILGELFSVFKTYFKNSESCTTVLAPFDIHLVRQNIKLFRELSADDTNVVQPDLLVLCDYEKDLDEKEKYWGVPTLTVEILSPSTRTKDRVKKLDLYMESGVSECWIVDPENNSITICTFNQKEPGRPRLEYDVTFSTGHTAASGLFQGLTIQVDTLFNS